MSTRVCLIVIGDQEGPAPFCARLCRHMDEFPSEGLMDVARVCEASKGDAKRLALALIVGPGRLRLLNRHRGALGQCCYVL